jgi:hypothetical protein
MMNTTSAKIAIEIAIKIRNFTTFGILLFFIVPATTAIEGRDTRALGFVVMRLLLTVFVGAIVGAATGYAVAAAGNSPDSAGIIVWSTGAHIGAMDTILWAILGAGVAAELSYFRNR